MINLLTESRMSNLRSYLFFKGGSASLEDRYTRAGVETPHIQEPSGPSYLLFHFQF